MFADAWRELRHHPGRIVATLVAIAISVGFMSAVSIFVDTQTSALGKMMALPSSKADVVVDIANPKQGVTPAQVEQAVKKAPGLTAVERSVNGFAALSTDKSSAYVNLYGVPGEQFRWAELSQGTWPTRPTEVALSQPVADKLGITAPGQQVEAGPAKLTVTGITDDVPSIFFQSAYAAPAGIEAMGSSGSLGFRIKSSDPQATIDALRPALVPLVENPDERPYPGAAPNLMVDTAEHAQREATSQMTGDFDVMKYLLLAFSGIAALVGIIIIANTFTILLAQRRRQIGLLRAVGASGAQVRRRFLAEAVLLGALGSALGLLLGVLIATVGSWFTDALHFGLSLPVGELAAEFGVGVVLTVLAAMLPSLRATRVAPLEALQPVATSEQARRGSIVRAIICGAIGLLGIFLAVTSLSAPVGDGQSVVTGPVARAVLGAGLISLAVLFGAPLFIPTVLRAMGALFGLAGATPRLAASNAVRNPRRASATATALMLACGLIVTLQVGTATAERTVLAEIAARYPVDLTVSSYGKQSTDGRTTDYSLDADTMAALDKLPNVARRAVLPGGAVTSEQGSVSTVLKATPQARELAGVLPAIGDDQVLVSRETKAGTPVELVGNGQTVTLKAVPNSAMGYNQAMVSDASFAKLVARPAPTAYWIDVADEDDLGTIMTQLGRVQMRDQSLSTSGSATESYMIKQLLRILLLVTTGLLGAAVLIALIGVSNTLGLSVIERARESALLRALGMQKSSLRLMLLVEALMLALAGVLVGVLAGGFFGWLGMKALLRQAEMDSQILFGVNWPMTLGLIAVAVLAAALTSVLPGRRAAGATPTEALAEE
ncbi:ABC transporter permease [Luteococcus peritonei]|uniref:ABC transporter permease n=1 Tax=Luteococcus peritonei TaxID=88874 RepID=A0ABW4RYH4_9ACTN